MFHTNQNLNVVWAVEPVDLRKSFNGLYAIAHRELGEVPENGAFFVFSNWIRTWIKVLCFDGTGCWVSVKQLEKGTFSWPKGLDKEKSALKLEAQALLLDGVDLRGAQMRPWYQRLFLRVFRSQYRIYTPGFGIICASLIGLSRRWLLPRPSSSSKMPTPPMDCW